MKYILLVISIVAIFTLGFFIVNRICRYFAKIFSIGTVGDENDITFCYNLKKFPGDEVFESDENTDCQKDETE